MRFPHAIAFVVVALLFQVPPAMAGAASAAAREVAEFVVGKFGKRAPTQTVDDVAAAVAAAAGKHGDDALPFLRATGHSGLQALEAAGQKSPEVIKLFMKRGDDAVWLISKPDRLAIFLKHGDNAADALLNHPGIAEDLITKFGDDAARALNKVSESNGRRLGILEAEGVLAATPRSAELLAVVQRHGDTAMDFIWKNKGALTVVTVLGGFLADPQAYFTGVKTLVVDPVAEHTLKSVNWTLVVLFVVAIVTARLWWRRRSVPVHPAKAERT